MIATTPRNHSDTRQPSSLRLMFRAAKAEITDIAIITGFAGLAAACGALEMSGHHVGRAAVCGAIGVVALAGAGAKLRGRYQNLKRGPTS